MDREDAHVYKIILIGDATVGKTHLLTRYIRGTLPKSPQPTIGVEFATRTVALASGGTVKAQIWDTAGQERYRSITSAHYRRAVGALLVYDVTRKSTFLNAAKWLEEVRGAAEPDIVIMLVGNKVDLVEENSNRREVSYDQVAQFAKRENLFFFETSATTSFNVKNVFEHLVQEIYNRKTQCKIYSGMDNLANESGGGIQLTYPDSGVAGVGNNRTQGAASVKTQPACCQG